MNERYSFLDVFKKGIDLDKDNKVRVSKIVIPKIQRPYAQGRQDNICTYVRNTLLDEMFANFNTDEIFDFNFIYGVVRQSNTDQFVMELLDGQQRMTTLFLLYWYIANRELSKGEVMDNEIREALQRFVYETRSSSTVFCNKLAGCWIDMSVHKPSEIITQAKWYFKSFDRDSTITAMLTMLDAIHKKYSEQECRTILPKLDNIQFYVKSLGFFNLSEELYIKMNARGLQLSPFENFKADLTNFISDSNFEPFAEYVPLYKKDSKVQVQFFFNFSVKLDAKWIDIFWNKGFENFDASYMSFFSRFFACKYIISQEKITDKEIRQDLTLKNLFTDAENRMEVNEYLGFQEFEVILKKHPEYVLVLDKVLDVFYEFDYENDRKTIYTSMLPVWDKSTERDGDDFYCNTKSKMTQIKLILFGAVIEFIDAYDTFDENIFKQWMRVVWNVVENTNIDSLTPTSSLIRKFSAIIHYVAQQSCEEKSFYDALAQWKDDRENRAVLEEVEKAKCIVEDNNWLSAFEEMERHPYFKGMVLFFYRSGMSLEQYKHNSVLAAEMFDETGISSLYRKTHLLIRAIASQLSSWEDLNETYITERAESNKYLKNILASNVKVKNMLADVLSKEDITAVKQSLVNCIANASAFEPWPGATYVEREYCNMAFNRICNDQRLYDWIADDEQSNKNVFRVYWYKGHITFAVPRKMYARVALDTERAKVAYDIASKYELHFDDYNQRIMFQKYGDSYGNEIWLYKYLALCKLWIGFSQNHELCIRFECDSQQYAQELQGIFEGSRLGNDPKWLLMPSLIHFKKDKTMSDLEERLEHIFKVVPETERLI
ncbi:MAG: DUF262 domain-containing protein [Bacteroidales bacterium]|nr:DUF262 domain-containing protein [Bacteroidales bacterium]